MHILITGASGLIGRAVSTRLHAQGHDVIPLSRGAATAAPSWDIPAGRITLGALPPIDAVIHLAGENIASGRWTPAVRQRIHDSRVDGTRLLASAIAALSPNPRVLVSASAIGLYGDTGDAAVTEASPPGTGFLASVCRDWEAAAQPARDAGIRVVHPRLGIVLATDGGALPRMLPLFRAGLGGPIGNGRQVMSWIHIADAVEALATLATQLDIEGPVNLTAPEPVTNRVFTRILGRVLQRPAILPAPALAIRLILGAMGSELLLSGARVQPRVLQEQGFAFRFPTLEPAFRNLLRKDMTTP